MECVAFHFLNKLVGRLLMFIFQDDNVNIHLAQTVKEWLCCEEHEESFSPLSPDLKFIESALDELYRELDSCFLKSRPKTDSHIDGNKRWNIISIKRCIHFWFHPHD